MSQKLFEILEFLIGFDVKSATNLRKFDDNSMR